MKRIKLPNGLIIEGSEETIASFLNNHLQNGAHDVLATQRSSFASYSEAEPVLTLPTLNFVATDKKEQNRTRTANSSTPVENEEVLGIPTLKF